MAPWGRGCVFCAFLAGVLESTPDHALHQSSFTLSAKCTIVLLLRLQHEGPRGHYNCVRGFL